MQPESEQVKQWLERANTDLRSAKLAMTGQPPITEDACFHCQQAVEKSLKAFLVHHEVEYEWTHEIERRVKACAQIDSEFELLFQPTRHLTDYAVRFRYPHFDPPPTVQQACRDIEAADRVWQFVLDRIPEQKHP